MTSLKTPRTERRSLKVPVVQNGNSSRSKSKGSMASEGKQQSWFNQITGITGGNEHMSPESSRNRRKATSKKASKKRMESTGPDSAPENYDEYDPRRRGDLINKQLKKRKKKHCSIEELILRRNTG